MLNRKKTVRIRILQKMNSAYNGLVFKNLYANFIQRPQKEIPWEDTKTDGIHCTLYAIKINVIRNFDSRVF